MSEITDLKRFCILNKKRWYLIPVLMIAGAVFFGGIYYIVMTLNAGDTVYRCKAYYYITFDEKEDETVTHYYNSYTWNDVLDCDLIAGRVAKNLGMEKQYIADVSSVPGLSDVRFFWVYVDTADKEESVKIQNAFADVLPEFAASTPGFDSIVLWDAPTVSSVTEDFVTGRVTVFGGCVGLIAGILLLMFLSAVDDRVYVMGDVKKYIDTDVAAVIFTDGTVYIRPLLNQDNKIYIYDRNGQYKSDYYRDALSKTVKTGQINVTDKDAVNIVEDKKAILLVPVRMGDTGRGLSLAADEIKTLGFENVYALICDADKKMYEHYYGKSILDKS
ncbi:MAG: hypothetical protein IKR70_00595 [Lachnospiraceae bacterium]|nr:hypothetical protein [Lachnospiraceae bacterium]